MRNRFAVLLLPAALLLLLLMPAQAIAAPSFSVTVERDTCVAGAGKYHFGQGVLRVRIIEYNQSGASRFTFTAQVWHLPLHSSTWSKEYQWPLYETSFPDNNQSYYNSRQYAYAPDHNAYHKIVVRVRALHGNTVLYSKLIQGKTC
ncbi:MAG: hypothetical protein QOJ81_2334 [Chloroflexota bacterium]|jgi:hypothetical protein|nr:hypothetical protein [Chloroflexota bacterium]